ncbi:monovalent cation/H+ antiporter subunit D family protein [Papillibacter cinnamivorans]|uniref:Multicomponent Na+:H+ antiporter subunit D n=1 Tax=Papillibacter cinnamivorans DSM 12816 TaxID=1122930 RepID=A0A1W2C4G3_9FIRM|nr:monovalent cation/H+ antiporter subunit D family protein [Papillibacter cinnamivorans]SMC79981.1 multicomponent Na+:H+ antiporter subunit D [Papillibacter cinnamivorans DSM 12816]
MAEIVYDCRPLWAVLISLIAAGLILLSGRHRNLREFWTIAAAAGKIAIVWSMLPIVLAGKTVVCTPVFLGHGLSLTFRVDAAGLLFAMLASGLWLITSFYSIGYMRTLKEEHQTGYFAAFAVCLSSAVGIALSGNLLTFFIFFEMLTLSTWPLVIHERNQEAMKAGRQYLVYTLVSGQLTLAGIALTYAVAGSLDFVPGGFLAGSAPKPMLVLIFVLLLAGPLVKAGLMPMHGWLPRAMIAPTPVSALLHAVAVVKAGCFGVIRITGFVFGPELMGELGVATPLAVLAAITIILASVIALTQPNLKQRLAYSTIGQLSYIILGMSLLSPLAILGAIFHLFAHAVMKITLFFTAGAIYTKTHTLEIDDLSGMGRVMPLTFAAFTLCSLGIAGMPFVVGFLSKWDILLGAIDGGNFWVVVVLAVSALLSVSYLIPIPLKAFRGATKPELANIQGEPRALTLVPLLITAVLALVCGIFPDFPGHFYQLAEIAVRNITAGCY